MIARIERHDGKVQRRLRARFFPRPRGCAYRRCHVGARRDQAAARHPLTVKESFNVGGLPTTWGFPAQKNFVPPEDALSISRIKDAGGVILGKTNVPVGLGDWQSYNEIYGTTNQPVRSRPHARRLLRRVVGGAGRGLRAALYGLRYRRLVARAGVSLRCLCPQADLRAGPVARPYAAAVSAAAIRPRPLCDRADGALGRRPVAAARCGCRPRPAGSRQGLSARTAGATSQRDQGFSRAADRQRSCDADLQGCPHGDRKACRRSRQGRRDRNPREPATAGLCRLDPALYAAFDVVPRRLVPAGGLCRCAGRCREARVRRYESGRGAGCAASRSAIATGCSPMAAGRGCGRNGASCSKASMP